MTEKEIHKCLISTGFYPMTVVLKDLEKQNRFEECAIILNAMKSYREKYKIVTDEIPTKWSEDFQKEYYSYFNTSDRDLIDDIVSYHVKDIENRLKL